MRKLDNKGFVLAETLVVTVFLMILFTMVYSNFYPLIGEYEKRETYDDVDGKYVAYWIKKLIENGSYVVNGTTNNGKRNTMNAYGFMRFECSDVSTQDQQRSVCVNLVRALEISGCDKKGDGCDIFITKYRIGDTTNAFKDTVLNTEITKNEEYSTYSTHDDKCKKKSSFQEYCECKNNIENYSGSEADNIKYSCTKKGEEPVFSSSFKDYVQTLPDYKAASLNFAEYRVFVIVKHRKDGNNYYSFSNTEVNK